MTNMRMNRRFRLATTTGHVVQWEAKDDIQPVPVDLVERATMYGAEVVDKNYTPPQPVTSTSEPKHVPAGAEREKAIKNAIAAICQRNNSEDFGAANAPKPTAIEKEVGFSVDTRERNVVWDAYIKETKSEASGS